MKLIKYSNRLRTQRKHVRKHNAHETYTKDAYQHLITQINITHQIIPRVLNFPLNL